MGAAASPQPEATAKAAVQVSLEDLELPPRRERVALAPSAAQLLAGGSGASAPSGAGASAFGPKVAEELLPGAEARGQRAFGEDGLVGTERQQLQLLAYYAELCEDFRQYQRQTREELRCGRRALGPWTWTAPSWCCSAARREPGRPSTPSASPGPWACRSWL
ncbi:unnamed protein product [Effrenium voratum]|uniref:Uncharacterized protein n=1 Tax=Effrenium voratum TaxID=2562239 RepID=A0AA36JPL5_9DINO|nr:unnamed protein product [Effrenium voratum]